MAHLPFTPLNLTGIWNVGAANVDVGGGWLWPGDDADSTPLGQLPAGERPFRGIPFRLGDAEGEARFVVVTKARCTPQLPEAVTIPVAEKAQRILFAHVCA